jgi:hypothetical protein
VERRMEGRKEEEGRKGKEEEGRQRKKRKKPK